MMLLVGIGKTFLDDYYDRMSIGLNLKEMGVLMWSPSSCSCWCHQGGMGMFAETQSRQRTSLGRLA
jgi:hypothetical protein